MEQEIKRQRSVWVVTHDVICKQIYGLIDWFLPSRRAFTDPDLLRRARLLIVSSFCSAMPTLLFAHQVYTLNGFLDITVGIFLITSFLFLFNPFLLRWSGATQGVGALVLLECMALDFLIAFMNGGFQLSSLLWATPLPIAAAFFVGPRFSVLITGLVVTLFAVMFGLEQAGFPFPNISPPEQEAWFTLMSLSLVTAFLALFGWLYESQTVRGLREMNDQLMEAKEEAEAMSRMKSTFLANMSHEIRTPLTAILGFAGVMAEETSRAEERELLQMIVESGHRLMETLTYVLDLAQLESGTLQLDVKPFDLVQQIHHSIERFRLEAERRRLTLEVVTPEETLEVVLDPGALHRILDNLVSNALKFTHRGGVRVVIQPEEARVVVVVEDTGIGIAPAFLPQVFDEFKQESSGLDRQYEGNGLGLTITKKMVELMAGEIDVTSRKGQGTTFQVRLPRRLSAPETSAVISKRPADQKV